MGNVAPKHKLWRLDYFMPVEDSGQTDEAIITGLCKQDEGRIKCTLQIVICCTKSLNKARKR